MSLVLDFKEHKTELTMFVRESNRIEGIRGMLSHNEIDAYRRFLSEPDIDVFKLCAFQRWIVPEKGLRDTVGMDVRVGDYVAPPGGLDISIQLARLLRYGLNKSPYHLHVKFELLHPFLDGNGGRTGRALWAWHMLSIGRDPFELPFLHRFYYQALEAAG